MYYAHSAESENKSNWQSLCGHLKGVASRAEHFGSSFGVAKAARLAGLLHDLGKYTREFQARLEGCGKPVDHSTAGAAVAKQLAKGKDGLVAELIAYAIAGHHAGLPDMIGDTPGSLSERLRRFSWENLDKIWKDELEPCAEGLLPSYDWDGRNRTRAAFQLAFLGRMIFSCLVDADYRDTEAFYVGVEGYTVDREWPRLQAVLPAMIEAFERHMGALNKADTAINRLRGEILAHVVGRAGDTPGLFTLTVPTGGGKTLASLGFALKHAREHGHERIIYCIPFTSIIDQTAGVFRGVFGEDLGDEVLLEHHSAIDREKLNAGGSGEGRSKLALAMEDWAAPLVVTTNVQFFESLFAARPSRCRKLHNIANSVIILDEAQTLPRHLLAPAVRALDELARNYGCTIVLCTATQPAFDSRNFPDGHPVALPLAGRELAPDPARLAEAFRRVTLHHAGELDDAALLEAMAAEPQGLVIVNSRKHALALYRQAGEAGLTGLVHLSTRQVAAHRKQILADVRRRLKGGEPCRVIATSLVEAGVDLDFPKVWRAEAGLDQIAQAAGRCNREGKRSVVDSLVTVFASRENPPPSEIKGLCGDLARMAHKYEDLLSPAAIEDFFGEVYWRLGERLDAKEILDQFKLSGGGTSFSYRAAAEKFRMIESGMAPVIVPWDQRAKKGLQSLQTGRAHAGATARTLQPYTVQVPPKARDLLIANGHVRFECEDCYGDQFAVLATESLYKPEVGLLWEDADYLELENAII